MDASLAVKVVVAEANSDKADALFEKWANEDRRLIAPAFFDVETDSIIRQKTALRKELSVEDGEAAFEKLQALPIQQMSLPGQRRRAWEIAKDFGFPTVYDATIWRSHNCADANSGLPTKSCSRKLRAF